MVTDIGVLRRSWAELTSVAFCHTSKMTDRFLFANGYADQHNGPHLGNGIWTRRWLAVCPLNTKAYYIYVLNVSRHSLPIQVLYPD